MSEQMDELHVMVARIDQRLGDFIDRADKSRQEDKLEVADLKKRLENLERWRAALIGGSAVVGAVASQVWSLLTK